MFRPTRPEPVDRLLWILSDDRPRFRWRALLSGRRWMVVIVWQRKDAER